MATQRDSLSPEVALAEADSPGDMLIGEGVKQQETLHLEEETQQLPLLQIVVDEMNSIRGTPFVEENGKRLDEFVKTSTAQNSVPPFSLIMMEGFFREENVDSLSECWKKCSEALVELEVIFPCEGNTFEPILPTVTFPNLKEFTVRHGLFPSDNGQETVETLRCTHFIHSVLSGAESLEKLVITHDGQGCVPAPESFKHLILPSSVTRVALRCRTTTAILEGILGRNLLPNLTNLCFYMSEVPYENGALFRVLDNLRETLKILTISGLKYPGPPRRISYLRLPVMENLRIFNFYSVNCELEDGHPPLEQVLPNLRKLRILNQTGGMFQKWTENSRFSTLDHLSVKTVDENFSDQDPANYMLSLSDLEMQLLPPAFPNLHKLEISISMEHASGLRHIFLEMEQLTWLRIHVTGRSSPANSDFWDGILIGAPIQVVSALRENPDFLEALHLKSELLSGIINLENLTTLALFESSTAPPPSQEGPLPHQPFISDLAFLFGFLKMVKLTELQFGKRFIASNRMAEKWRLLGGTYAYAP